MDLAYIELLVAVAEKRGRNEAISLGRQDSLDEAPCKSRKEFSQIREELFEKEGYIEGLEAYKCDESRRIYVSAYKMAFNYENYLDGYEGADIEACD